MTESIVLTSTEEWSSNIDNLPNFLFGLVMTTSWMGLDGHFMEKRVVVVEGYCYPEGQKVSANLLHLALRQFTRGNVLFVAYIILT